MRYLKQFWDETDKEDIFFGVIFIIFLVVTIAAFLLV